MRNFTPRSLISGREPSESASTVFDCGPPPSNPSSRHRQPAILFSAHQWDREDLSCWNLYFELETRRAAVHRTAARVPLLQLRETSAWEAKTNADAKANWRPSPTVSAVPIA